VLSDAGVDLPGLRAAHQRQFRGGVREVFQGQGAVRLDLDLPPVPEGEAAERGDVLTERLAAGENDQAGGARPAAVPAGDDRVPEFVRGVGLPLAGVVSVAEGALQVTPGQPDEYGWHPGEGPLTLDRVPDVDDFKPAGRV
jgi:hypothetical protein